MADIKISELPAAASVATTDVLVVNQGTTTRKATVSQALAGTLTTAQIAGLATTAPAALATAPVVGLSQFAARADHQHLRPSLADLGAQAALTTSAPLSFSQGGTSNIAYTDGQLLIGNTATGGLSKAALTAGSNVTITNGNGSISIAATGGNEAAGSFYEFFEQFLGTTSLSGNLTFGVTGGTNSQANSGFGVVAMSTGTAAAVTQQARLNQAGNVSLIGNSAARVIFRAGQSGPTWFDGTLTGAFRCGWGDSITAESANGIYFRVQNGQAIDFVTKAANVETVTATGVSFSPNTFQSLEILINAAGTQITAKIDGSTVATHTTNIPTARVFFFAHINRTAAIGTAVVANIDFVYLKVTPATPFF
jgi:hypothetical protein